MNELATPPPAPPGKTSLAIVASHRSRGRRYLQRSTAAAGSTVPCYPPPIRRLVQFATNCAKTTPMVDLTRITPGLTGTAELVVAPDHTAPFVGSGRIAVLATPVMINLIEAAALKAVK